MSKTNGRELALVRPESVEKNRNGAWVSKIGFSFDNLIYHLLTAHYGRRGKEDCTPECAARFCWNTQTPDEDQCDLINYRLGRLHREMLERGYYLAVDYSGKFGKITAFRVIAKRDSTADHQYALAKMERMAKLARTNKHTVMQGLKIVTKLALPHETVALLRDIGLRPALKE